MEAIQSWVSEHRLTSIGALGASLAYSRTGSPLKQSLRLILARMHVQALALAVLSGAAAYRGEAYSEARRESFFKVIRERSLTCIFSNRRQKVWSSIRI